MQTHADKPVSTQDALAQMQAQMLAMQEQMQALMGENATLKAQATTPTLKPLVIAMRYVAAGEINKRFPVANPRVNVYVNRTGNAGEGRELSATPDEWRTLLKALDADVLDAFIAKES